ncbi:tRNA (adenosine(37)-N6)-threonylcarbamoyltransferase complex ATPase subunit type 1 TsaE [Sphingosinicella rhizophila]|uniref:tRNA threonylcarbamoyladenosine biosynthesis protein TsaE n=1 Tax=Sphingosinicella rhizophila TaxID=3050082 RepID=A0ABU3Q2E9_9SPHN|nr:tRNA (adenosine(37)-N6)-threonylcarbamoyltransferase complex ATPase subunit type 1 TsaE [Sphingosinicella sp. GR2756]MDT9597590.1 tRNA (adenosine(37)-N6)-threonylcarbamoyltransferase complex ATPase subunit type 1 TsaE [Sphingosinicella sp. GR2756]
MLLEDEQATERLGRMIANRLRQGDVVALYGDLGAGKTTLARGILRGLGLNGDAPSPTFAIVQPYDDLQVPVWHIDLYRIEDPSELAQLGLEEAKAEAALLIEWPEQLGRDLWPDALRLTLGRDGKGGRFLTARVPPAWEARWPPR